MLQAGWQSCAIPHPLSSNGGYQSIWPCPVQACCLFLVGKVGKSRHFYTQHCTQASWRADSMLCRQRQGECGVAVPARLRSQPEPLGGLEGAGKGLPPHQAGPCGQGDVRVWADRLRQPVRPCSASASLWWKGAEHLFWCRVLVSAACLEVMPDRRGHILPIAGVTSNISPPEPTVYSKPGTMHCMRGCSCHLC